MDLFRILYAGGADVILNGHHHFYERFAPQDPPGAADPARGVREFIVGTGGESGLTPTSRAPNSEALNFSTFGVLRLVLRRGAYDWRFVGLPLTPELARSR